MKVVGIICVVVLAVLAIAFFAAPASLAGLGLEKATDGRLTISEAEGTLWSGSGFVAVIGKDGQAYALTPEPLVWTIEKLPLLWGEAVGKVAFSQSREIAENTPTADFHAASDSMSLGRLSTPINLPTVLKLVQGIELLNLGGYLRANVDQMIWQSGALQLNATVSWTQMRSALSPLNTVGSYNVLFQASGAPVVNIKLETLDGPLMLSADGQWRVGQGYRLEGYAETDEEHKQALQNMMMVLGVDRDGKRYFRFPAGGS